MDLLDTTDMLRRKRYACGRRAALNALDVLLAEAHNVQKLFDAMQVLFDESPVDFYERFGLAATPRSVFEEMAAEPVDATEVATQIKAMLDASGYAGGVVGTDEKKRTRKRIKKTAKGMTRINKRRSAE